MHNVKSHANKMDVMLRNTVIIYVYWNKQSSLNGIDSMSLDQALDELETDHDWLTKGDVFTKDMVATFIDFKRREEVDTMRQRPHPYEFELYHDL